MVKITDPLTINKMEIANRYVAAPMLTDTLDALGYVNERYIHTMIDTAKGGWGLVWVQAAMVHPTGQVVRNQIAIYDDSYTPGLFELASEIKRQGPKVGIQLFHAGALATPKVLRTPDRTPVSASPVPSFLNPAVKCRELSDKEIWELIDCYGAAAARAKEAEFDCVEIHACHGSLINQFIAPRVNKRTDVWGQNKLLFLTSVIESVRKNVGPDFPVVVRWSVDEHSPVGYTVDDTCKTYVPAIVKAGADAIDCTSGCVDVSGFWVIQPTYWEQGCLVKEARRVKEVAGVPVGTVGKIMDPKMAERIIEEGSADWVQLGRPSWADTHYAKKALEGRYEDVRKCIACDWCTYLYLAVKNVVARCAVNWEFGREIRYLELKKAEKPKDVLIVGGGIAGMEAARVATLRGHRVTIYEKKKLGGIINIASDIPYLYTTDLKQIADWLITQNRKLGVEVKEQEVTPELVEKLNPDAVIVATGSLPLIPDIPGIRGPNVITLDDYLWEKPELGKKIVVLGGVEGAEISVSLARQNKSVTLVSETDNIIGAPYLFNPMRTAALLLVYIPEAKVNVITNAKVKEITKDGVRILDKEGKEQFLEADNVVLAFGRKPVDELAKALRGKVKELYTIGDCVKPGAVYNAIDDANHVARLL
ncbi:FAD-dependent oxidoreductase [Candidatus Bathyarchaeota archaeon]|nr:FAD-dependent oxidoreductase [Candidatus Bathyarchaeota archaeon]